jgi:signal transduction histidine kinase
VINLLDNAVKYGGPGPITLRAALIGDRARIEVEDEGPGIPAAERARIWEPFVRLRPGSAVPGSGIGLAVVRELVAAHGGECRVTAMAGTGARFIVELPDATRSGEPGDGSDQRVTRSERQAPWPAS